MEYTLLERYEEGWEMICDYGNCIIFHYWIMIIVVMVSK